MKCEIVHNDITDMQVDAIVLPANSKLKEGSGTSAAIFEKAGREELEKACKRIGKVEVGHTVPTLGYALDARYILHTVVPKWTNGKHHEYELLSYAYLSALTLADSLQCKTIAFPLLASGNNGFNKSIAFEIAKNCIGSYEAQKELEKVYLVIYDVETMLLMKELGVSVSEYIANEYVLLKDQRARSKEMQLLEAGKRLVDLVYDDLLKIMLSATKSLEDPELRNQLEKQAVKIAGKALMKLAQKQ